MITRENYFALLAECCPSFEIVNDDYIMDSIDVYISSFDDNSDCDGILHYTLAGGFANHLLGLYRDEKLNDFENVGRMLEKFHTEGDDYIKELGTIGFLEGIQNVWGNNGLEPDIFKKWLGPVSLAYWESLNKFWNREIQYVGSDIDENTNGKTN